MVCKLNFRTVLSFVYWKYHEHELIWIERLINSTMSLFVTFISSSDLSVVIDYQLRHYCCLVESTLVFKKCIIKFNFLFKVCHKYIFMKRRDYVRNFLSLKNIFSRNQYIVEISSGLANLRDNLEYDLCLVYIFN